MQYGIITLSSVHLADLRFEYVRLSEGNSSHVLHGSVVELRDYDLVILGEGEWIVEESRVEIHPYHHSMEELVVLEIIGEILATVCFHRRVVLPPFKRVLILHVPSSNKCK